jgi:CheY-specific phosphatase CheX
MSANCGQIVRDVFGSVIERTAFMFGESVGKEDLPIAQTPYVQASMSFRGPQRGVLSIAMPRDACVQIAANVLGMEPEEPFVAQRATDSLKEILNVTCGHILTSLAGDAPVFDLSIPEVTDLDEEAQAALRDDPHTQAFLADECPVLLRLTVNED